MGIGVFHIRLDIKDWRAVHQVGAKNFYPAGCGIYGLSYDEKNIRFKVEEDVLTVLEADIVS